MTTALGRAAAPRRLAASVSAGGSPDRRARAVGAVRRGAGTQAQPQRGGEQSGGLGAGGLAAGVGDQSVPGHGADQLRAPTVTGQRRPLPPSRRALRTRRPVRRPPRPRGRPLRGPVPITRASPSARLSSASA